VCHGDSKTGMSNDYSGRCPGHWTATSLFHFTLLAVAGLLAGLVVWLGAATVAHAAPVNAAGPANAYSGAIGPVQ
jgi:hypothetical protein